jgi:PAS domain S-box-containing protein
MKTSVYRKVSWFLIGIISSITTIMLIIVCIGIWQVYFSIIGNRQKQDAEMCSSFIAHQIENEVSDIVSFSRSPSWREAVKEANLRYKNWEPGAINEYMMQMDKLWIHAREDSPVVSELLSNSVSQRLKAIADQQKDIVGIFLTDQYGGLVATSVKTNDFYQADELWWQRAYNKGKGDIFIGEIDPDLTFNKISCTIATPLKDEKGRVLGVSKTVLDIAEFFKPMDRYKFGKTGHVELLDEHGNVVYLSKIIPMKGSGLSGIELKRILSSKNDYGIISEAHSKTKFLISVARVMSPILEANGMKWVVVITQDENEFFLPLLVLLITGLILASGFFLLTLVLIRRSIKKIFIYPIEKIRNGVQHFSRGQLNYKIDLNTGDEIEDLADAFNNMILQLEKTTVSKDFLDNIIGSMSDMLVVVDSQLRITTVNRATCALLGYKEEELAGVNISRLFQKEEDLARTKTAEYYQEEGNLWHNEINLKAKDGKIIPVILSKAFLKRTDYTFGRPRDSSASFEEKFEYCEYIPGAVFVAKDITLRKKAEEELNNERAFIESTINAISDAFYVCDKSGKMLIYNEATKEVTGYSDGELHAMKATDFFSPEEAQRIAMAIQKIWEEGFMKVEANFRVKDGRQIPYEFTGSILKDGAGNVVGFSGTGRDLTERKKVEEELNKSLKKEVKTHEVLTSMLADNNEIRKKLENSIEKLNEAQAQLIHAEKMEAVGRMASGVAHEVKNPLGIILQGINYFEGKLPLEDRDNREKLQMMKNSVKRADNIVRGLLDFARVQELNIEPQDINAVIESSVNLVQHSLKINSIELVRELEKGLPKVLMDRGKIEQVFVNLFSNAVYAMPDGGKLFVRSYLKELREPKNKIGNREGDIFRLGEEAIIVEIEDTGVGMDEYIISKIFDPFFTTKNRTEGTGLGLSVSKSIIDMHNGLIEVESAKGNGAKFTIIFKISEAGRR